MNAATSDELTHAIGELREIFPDWRMGQLIANLVTAAGGDDPADLWDVEDTRLMDAARRLIDRNRNRNDSDAGD